MSNRKQRQQSLKLAMAGLTQKTARKYRNVRCNGFDSKGEAARFQVLSLLEKAGKISNLRTQVPYKFIHNSVLLCKYIADFVYIENGIEIVEDFKSPITRKNPVYAIKKKMMMAFYGIEIRETSRK